MRASISKNPVAIWSVFGVALSLCLRSGASPSDDYLRTARAAYVRPEYAACTNTVVTQWKIAKEDLADQPTTNGLVGWVHVEGMRNVRDIGGWTGLKTGRAYRGTEPDSPRDKNGDSVHGLYVTPNGLRTMRSELRIATDLDLRRAFECPHPDYSELGVPLVRVPVRAYGEFDATRAHWTAALRLFADSRYYPIYFHCYGGADRTGILAFLLEGLCGVSECDLCIDYELTTFAGFPRSRDPNGQAKRGFVDMLERIKARPGAELKDKFADFAEKVLGLTKQEIEDIRRNLMKPVSTAPN